MAGSSGHYGINSYLRIDLSIPECRYVYEHRLIMMGELGRLITAKELVHHRNNVRFDNRASNLKLTDKRGHEKFHPIWNKGTASGKWNDPDFLREYYRIYRERNREKINENNRRYKKRKRNEVEL